MDYLEREYASKLLANAHIKLRSKEQLGKKAKMNKIGIHEEGEEDQTKQTKFWANINGVVVKKNPKNKCT